MPSPATCLVISDGRRGIENQALGLAEHLAESISGLRIQKHIVTHGTFFKTLPAKLQFLFRPGLRHYGLSTAHTSDNTPAIAIGCGRQAIAPLRALKRAKGSGVFTVYIQDPRITSSAFDAVVAPEHDGLSGDNVIPMIGSPNRISAARLSEAAEQFSRQLTSLPTPRVAMLIGGDSKSHTLDKTAHIEHINALNQVLETRGSAMITTSRRTPNWVRADYQKMAKRNPNIWLWDGQTSTGDNPYFGFLSAADTILVTQDSTNMLTEACATGQPVFTLPMSGNAGKFTKLYASLAQRCHMSPFTGTLDAQNYEPLNETKRVASLLAKIAMKNKR